TTEQPLSPLVEERIVVVPAKGLPTQPALSFLPAALTPQVHRLIHALGGDALLPPVQKRFSLTYRRGGDPVRVVEQEPGGVRPRVGFGLVVHVRDGFDPASGVLAVPDLLGPSVGGGAHRPPSAAGFHGEGLVDDVHADGHPLGEVAVAYQVGERHQGLDPLNVLFAVDLSDSDGLPHRGQIRGPVVGVQADDHAGLVEGVGDLFVPGGLVAVVAAGGPPGPCVGLGVGDPFGDAGVVHVGAQAVGDGSADLFGAGGAVFDGEGGAAVEVGLGDVDGDFGSDGGASGGGHCFFPISRFWVPKTYHHLDSGYPKRKGLLSTRDHAGRKKPHPNR